MNNRELGHDTTKRQEMQVVMPLNIGMQCTGNGTGAGAHGSHRTSGLLQAARSYQHPTRKDEATAKQRFQLTVLGFITGKMKVAYKAAYDDGDMETASVIEDMLLGLGLGYSMKDIIKWAQEE